MTILYDENLGSNPSDNSEFQTILDQRLSRRGFLRTGTVMSSLSLLAGTSNLLGATATSPASLSFQEVPQGLDDKFTVADGYQQQVLLRWGDPLFADAPAFDPANQSQEKQERQFGFNNDFIGFLPLPLGSTNSNNGLLVVNHEYSDTSLMFPPATASGETVQPSPAATPRINKLTLAQVNIDIASLGLSVVEIRKNGEQWQAVKDSPYNRRITPLTPMQMTGPAAGSPRLHTLDCKDGISTLGTYGNCAGGVTPWGTILTGEENVDAYFNGDASQTDEAENYQRFGARGSKPWGTHHPRWDLSKNPHELLHMGWVVEIDPYDPSSVPKKRTALGRFKHEGANIHVDADGTVVAYTGDDSQFEYIYKFISKAKFNPSDRKANLDLLAAGTLHAARFNADGSLNWLPLVFGQGPLTAANGFKSQADVMLDCRKAADLLGATKMDRPEDVEVNPVNGKVYAMLTNNARRSAEQLDAVNPRAANGNGQIIEFWPANGKHSSDTFQWELFLLAGNPKEAGLVTAYHPGISDNGWLSCPDNCAFDKLGNLWIATDGADAKGIADGMWATEVDGPARGLTKRFLRTPIGAEMCGPFFTPDSENFFCSVQHPAEGSSWDNPSTRWPDFDPALPPRPSVVVITKKGGGRIGS
jgi:uncharacterized protein